MGKDDEIWVDIPGYEKLYQVSNLTRVKSLGNNFTRKEKIKKHIVNNIGYCQVVLYKNGVQKIFHVHQLMAIVFLNHIPNKYKLVVDHIDGNTLNNSLSNLQIVTCRENKSICYRKNELRYTSKYIGVCWRKDSRNWRATITIDGKKKSLGCFSNELDASNAYQNALLQITTNL